MYQKARIIKKDTLPKKEQDESVESCETRLRVLLSAPVGLHGLLEYLDMQISNAESEYKDAACKAVFDESARINAVYKYGVMDGLKRMYTRIEALRTTGK